MNHGVKFEVNGVSKHSLDDFGLWLNPVDIPYPKVKENYIEKTFGDGSIDLTEVDGRVYYEDRAFSLSFQCKDSVRYTTALNDLIAFLHGKKVKMTFYFDDGFYYQGRAAFNKYTSDKGIGNIDLDVTVRPYKYKNSKTTIEFTTTSDAYTSKTFTSGAMPAVPTIKCTVAGNVKQGENEFAIEANKETTFPAIIFERGENNVEFKGDGTWTVTYQEGEL